MYLSEYIFDTGSRLHPTLSIELDKINTKHVKE